MAKLINRYALFDAIRNITYNSKDSDAFFEEVLEVITEQPTTTEAEIRAKAIDEFAEKLKWELGQLIFTDSEKFAHPVKEQEQICYQNMTLKRAIRLVEYLAEQLKEE